MATMRETYNVLLSAQKKRARGAPAYSIFVNRPVGRLLATLAFHLGWTPNQVTLVSALFTFTGIGLLAFAPLSVPLGVAIWLLLALGYAWDSADGQVARLRGGGSLAGEWLDHVVDAVKTSALHLAVLIGAYRWLGEVQPWLLVPIVFTIVANSTFFAMLLNDLLKQKRGVPTAIERGGSSTLRSLLVLPTDYGFLCLAFVTWGWFPVFQVVYALFALAAVLFWAAAMVKWFRDMTAVDAALTSA